MVAPVHGKKSFGLSGKCQKVALEAATLHFAYPIGIWRERRWGVDRPRRRSPFFREADKQRLIVETPA
jgi:hypothetical protein